MIPVLLHIVTGMVNNASLIMYSTMVDYILNLVVAVVVVVVAASSWVFAF